MLKDYFQLPANYTWLSYPYNSSHTAIDLGFLTKVGPNQPLYPLGEGKIVQSTWYTDGGNTLVIQYEDKDNTWFSEYMHNLGGPSVPVGTEVGRGTKVANMGNSGKSQGPHVHLVLYKTPKGTQWNSSSNSALRNRRVNPLDYVYQFPNQEVASSYNGKDKIIKTKPSTPYNKPTPAGKDVTVNGQVHRDSAGNGPGVVLKNYKGKITAENKGAKFPYHIDQLGWVSASAVSGNQGGDKPTPTPSFKPYAYTIPAQSTLYNDALKPYSSKTTVAHKVTIDKEKSGYGHFKAGWLVGVSDAWVKLGNKPAPKPQPAKKGKYVNFGGKVRLFLESRGDACYTGRPGKYKNNYYTNVKNRSAIVLKEDNGRVLVDIPAFSPSKVWIANADSQGRTDYAKY